MDLLHCLKIIERDKQGFGLTVSGDNPVFVEIVKKGKYSMIIIKVYILYSLILLKTICYIYY